jgi:L-threonylcarbamoyladenylate synthase
VSTSANRAGAPPISSIDELENEVAEGVDFALDTGLVQGEPSTIVDFTGEPAQILREGDPLFAQNLRKTLRISLCKT